MKTTSERLWLRRLLALAALSSGGCVDALVGDADVCSNDAGKSYAAGEKFQVDCQTCVCQLDGTTSCTGSACVDDAGASDDAGLSDDGGGSGTPTDANWFGTPTDASPPGTPTDANAFGTPIDASVEETDAQAAPDCTTHPCAVDAGTTVPAGSCFYNGAIYPLYAAFLAADGCNKCQCVMNGTVECSNSCVAPTPGCSLGEDRFDVGRMLVCPDGCNDCVCDQSGSFSQTKRACPALPAITQCPNDLSVSAFSAAFIYQKDDVLAVAESRCVNGQTNDFQLCYDGLGDQDAGVQTNLYVFANGGTRACNALEAERVFSLKPLVDRLSLTNPNGGKILLHGDGRTLYYSYGP